MEIVKGITDQFKTMFSGLDRDAPVATGKRMIGFPSSREPEFRLGWDSANNLNDFQMRKSKNQEVTGKITTGASRPPSQVQAEYSRPIDYERLLYENQDLPVQELQKLMMKYEDYRGVGVQQPTRRKEGLSEKSNLPEMRQPIRPKESMRDIMYSGVGVGVEEPSRVGSRRNNSSFKPDSHVYQPKR